MHSAYWVGQYIWMAFHSSGIIVACPHIVECLVITRGTIWEVWRGVILPEADVPDDGIWGFESHARLRLTLLLPTGSGCSSQLLLQCLPTYHHVPHHNESGLNLWSVIKSPTKCILSQELPWSWCVFTAIEQWLRYLITSLVVIHLTFWDRVSHRMCKLMIWLALLINESSYHPGATAFLQSNRRSRYWSSCFGDKHFTVN